MLYSMLLQSPIKEYEALTKIYIIKSNIYNLAKVEHFTEVTKHIPFFHDLTIPCQLQ